MAAVFTAVLLAIGLLAAPPPSTASAAPRDIDNSSQESVRDAYLTWLRPTLSVPATWDGDPSRCVSGSPDNQPAAATGTFSSQGRAATLEAINYYREMAGLQPVTEYAPGSHLAQQAALIMHANNTLTHEPTSGMTCYSMDGATGAATSNLAIGWVGARAISTGFVDDPGPGNVPVGHRRWVLYPPLSGVGIGSTSKSTSLVVFGNGSQHTNPRPAGGIAWPSAGYVPWETMPTSGRWSYGVPGVNVSAANVTMTKNGSPVPVTVTRSNELYGDPAVIWDGGPIAEPAVDTVDTYAIEITGLPGGTVSYEVKTFRAAVARVSSVTVAGDARVGSTLTATAHDPEPAGATVSYAWYADGEQVGTKQTYSVAAKDVGKPLVVKATAASGDWATSSTSSNALTVQPGVLTPTGVGIDGSPVVGESLSFIAGQWGPSTSYALQWLRNGNPISGAVSATYRLTTTDLGATIALRVTGSATGYTSVTVTTPSLGPVTAPVTPTPTPTTPAPPKKFTKVPTPTVSGTAQVGKTLTAKPGSWSPTPTRLTYQWYRSGKAIAGATGRTYMLAPSTKGGTITVRVTASRTGYATATSKPSKATKKVKAGTITAAKPKISGTPRVGKTLTAAPGKWKPTTTTFSYQWYRNGSKIKKATKSSYLLVKADKGKKISVKVTGKAPGYTTKAKASSKTRKVGG
ncbi:MAG: CAP domain-containing protein [Microlunatus sp.]